MKLILTSDLHQWIPKWTDLVDLVRRERPRFVLVAGDLLPKQGGHDRQRSFFPALRGYLQQMKAVGGVRLPPARATDVAEGAQGGCESAEAGVLLARMCSHRSDLRTRASGQTASRYQVRRRFAETPARPGFERQGIRGAGRSQLLNGTGMVPVTWVPGSSRRSLLGGLCALAKAPSWFAASVDGHGPTRRDPQPGCPAFCQAPAYAPCRPNSGRSHQTVDYEWSG